MDQGSGRSTRGRIGRVGVWAYLTSLPARELPPFAERVEELGYDPADVRTVTEAVIARPAQTWAGYQYDPGRQERVTTRKLWRNGQYEDVPSAPLSVRYDVGYIARYALCTRYPQIVFDVAALLDAPSFAGYKTLFIDSNVVE